MTNFNEMKNATAVKTAARQEIFEKIMRAFLTQTCSLLYLSLNRSQELEGTCMILCFWLTEPRTAPLGKNCGGCPILQRTLKPKKHRKVCKTEKSKVKSSFLQSKSTKNRAKNFLKCSLGSRLTTLLDFAIILSNPVKQQQTGR